MDVREETYYLDRIRSGDRQAFSWVVDRYKDLVYTLCLRMLTDAEDAADAAQEVFVKAFRSLESFRNQSRFSTWIYRITYNHCISVIRKKVKVIDLVDEFHEDKDPETRLDGLEALSRKERSRYLQAAVEALPETDALVVTLFYYEELSLEEIAEITGLSSGNIRIKLHRSRKKLYQVLKQQLKSEIKSIV
jgi:RNA polymerase sigma-70 factor (ECF subfamily)